MNILLVLASFVLVHGPGGTEVSVNIGEISSIRQVIGGRDPDAGLHHKDVKCLVVMTNGKFIGTTETCIEILHMISDSERGKQ
jgi:hypothetical protein